MPPEIHRHAPSRSGRPPIASVGRRTFGLGALTMIGSGMSVGAHAALPSDARILVGAALGSVYDKHARVLARHLTRLAPGLRITVEAIPRAGGKLVAKMVNESAGDGRTVGLLPSGLILAELLGEEGVAFALERMNWIGSIDADLRILVLSRKLGIDSVDAMRRHPSPITLAAVTTGSSSWYEPLLLNRVLGLRLKPVPGYSSVSRVPALMSGEVGAAIGTLDTFAPLLADGHAIAVLRLNDLPLPGAASLPPVMLADEAIDRHPEIRKVLDGHFRFGRGLCLGPQTAPPITQAWREIFDRTVRDEEYAAEVRMQGLALRPVRGAALAALLGGVFAAAAPTRAALEAALSCGMKIADNGPPGC